jgi:MEMO1 family protein
VAPHIDYTRGGDGYGAIYGALYEGQFDILLLLGTSHQFGERLFILTEKDFITPLGTVPCAKNVVRSIARKVGPEVVFSEELRHKKEHSLELQLPFLQTQNATCEIIPLLVGSFHSFVTSRSYPEENSEYKNMVVAVAETLSNLEQAGKRVGIIAGVDMAHIGPHFGDAAPLTENDLEKVKARDVLYLQAFCSRDKHVFFDHMIEDGDARRVCGYPSLYFLLHVLEEMGTGVSMDIVDYQQAVNDEKTCGVTFSSIALHKLK